MNDQLTIGGSLNLQYYLSELGTSVATSTSPSVATDLQSTIEGEDLNLGFPIGMEYQFNENTRLGLSYRSAIDHSFDGDLTLSGSDTDFAVGQHPFGKAETVLVYSGDLRKGIERPLRLRHGDPWM